MWPKRIKEQMRAAQYFRCSACNNATFDTIQGLICHVYKCTCLTKIYQCAYCSKRYRSCRLIKTHSCRNGARRVFFSFNFFDMLVSTNNVIHTFVD